MSNPRKVLEKFIDPTRNLLLGEKVALEHTLRGQGVLIPIKAFLIRKCKRWAVSLPLRFYQGDYKETFDGLVAHLEQQDALYKKHLEANRQDKAIILRWDPRIDTFVHDGMPFYTLRALLALFRLRPHDIYLKAFIQDLERADDSLEGLPRKPKKQRLTPQERLNKYGGFRRGASWEPWEDDILRQWFSIRDVDGIKMHVRMLPEYWVMVLELLKGYRSKNSILSRLGALNRQLKQTFVATNGLYSRLDAITYANKVLGEKPDQLPVRGLVLPKHS